MKKADLLKQDHEAQIKWLDNQMLKIANEGAKSFSNVKTAERAYKTLKSPLILDKSDLEHFIGCHLSPDGMKKLMTTLKVRISRNSGKKLQVDLNTTAKNKLDRMVENSVHTQRELITLLIMEADESRFKRNEEQLEITM